MPFNSFSFGRLLALWLLLVWSPFVAAQTLSEMGLEEEFLEQLLDDFEQEIDLSELTERLRYYLAHPIDINTASERQLAALLFLSPLQIANILTHREKSGAFLSVLELQAIASFDVQTVERLLPFIRVSPDGTPRLADLHDGKQQLILRYGRILERQRGYSIVDTNRSRYLGNADRYMLRYRLNYNDQVRLAINMDKDAGEPFFSERQRAGFDHYGISLQIKGKTWLQDLVVGDYALQVGQGLVFWNGLAFGKGAMITSSARQGVGLRSYTSMNEVDFLRGLAARMMLSKSLYFTPFASWRKLSGGLTETNEGTRISSIAQTGLHRTPNELANRQQIDQYVYGFDLSYSRQRLKLGFVGAHTRYGWPRAISTLLRNLDQFTGQGVTNVGLNYQTTFQNIYVFGEWAYQWQGAWATLHGMIASLNPQFSVFVNYRNYQRQYHAPFSQALGEGTAVSSEKGLYAGVSYRLGRKIEWTSYVDQFWFPWLRYGVNAPSQGIDVLSQFSYIWYKVGRINLRYRYRARQANSDEQMAEHMLADVYREQLRLDFHYKLSSVWEIRSRVEAVFFDKETRSDFGGLVYQDVFWKPRRLPVQGNLRLAFFQTDSYDARLYAFENDVLYANSFPLYYGKGWRSYANIRYRAHRKVDCWLRYRITRYSGVETVGSGLDVSDGPIRSDINVQIRYQW